MISLRVSSEIVVSSVTSIRFWASGKSFNPSSTVPTASSAMLMPVEFGYSRFKSTGIRPSPANRTGTLRGNLS